MKLLKCCCCGSNAIGRHHWNRDTGYGLCASCVVWLLQRPNGADEISQSGTPGKHYAVPLAKGLPVGALVSFKTFGDDDYRVGTITEWDNNTCVIREHRKIITGDPDQKVAVNA